MSKEKRLARRAARKEKRLERQQKFEALKTAMQDAPDLDTVDESRPYKERFTQIWPVVDAALDFAIELRVTKDRTDQAFERIKSLGSKMVQTDQSFDENEQEFLEKLGSIWGKVRSAFIIAKVFANDEVDKVLDKTIEIGDWILGNGDDDE